MMITVLGLQEPHTFETTAQRVLDVQANQTTRLLTVILGSCEMNIEAQLRGKGAAFFHDVLYLGSRNDTISINTISRHQAVNTKAVMRVHGVATEKSAVNVTGNIFIEPGAQQTDGELEHEGLLMSRGARISALPGFEIHTNDVQARHSSAVHFIRDEQLFYLQSRGIDQASGRRMILEGFLHAMLESCDDATAHEQLASLLNAKIDSIPV